MTESLRGKFLVSGKELRDRNFFKTVVLLVEHVGDGAMGLVINRPSSLSIKNALAGHLDVVDGSDMVFVGGPVEPADLFLLHTDDSSVDAFDSPAAILPGLFITNTAEEFESVLTSNCAETSTKVFSGYAGWAAGQLEQELARGDWLIAEASLSDVFDTPSYDLWDNLRANVVRSHQLFTVGSANPEWN